MVGKLASRRAGKSLLAIVLALTLPLVVLGGLYVRQAWLGIRFVDREVIGIGIIERVYVAALFDDKAWTEEELQEIAALELRLGKESDLSFKTHLATARSKQEHEEQGSSSTAANDTGEAGSGKDQETAHHHEDDLTGYLADVGDASGLILDADVRSYHLANAFVAELPKVVDEFETLVRSFAGSKDKQSQVVASATETQQGLGRVYASYDSLQEAIEAANIHGAFSTTFEFRALEQSLQKILAIAKTSEMKLGQLTFTSRGLSEADKAWFMDAVQQLREAAKTTSEVGLPTLGRLLNERRNAQTRELMLFGAFGLVGALLGLLMSAVMFRRTFSQLDRVTDLHEAAELSRAETERINGEVAKLNVDLSEKMQRLQQAQDEIVKKGRMEQLGQLTATVAHELRNPLGAVRTSAFLIEKKVAGKGLGLENQLSRISSGITRCDNIITQLLDYSRTKKVTPRLGDLDEWLAGVVSEEASKFPEKVRVECTLGLGGEYVEYDSARLQRAVVNLMTNAVEAMVGHAQDPSHAAVAYPMLWISTARRGSDIVMRVKDNGPGIAAENLERIREPLFTTKNFGTGLGIPAVEQVALQHGGHLEVESRLGEGACFSLILPHRPLSTTNSAA